MQEHDDLVVGHGVEIVDIERFEQVLARYPRVKDRLFTPAEQLYCAGKTFPLTHMALCFAAKQAVFKILDPGFSGVRFSTVEIDRDEKGRPIPVLSGAASNRAAELGIIESHLSTTYTDATVVASAVALTQEARPVTEEELTFEEKMNRAFCEARALLDQLTDSEEGASKLGDALADVLGTGVRHDTVDDERETARCDEGIELIDA